MQSKSQLKNQSSNGLSELGEKIFLDRCARQRRASAKPWHGGRHRGGFGEPENSANVKEGP